MRKYVLITLFLLIISLTVVLFSFSIYQKNKKEKIENIPVINTTITTDDQKEENKLDTEILISAVGDCTIGYDDNFGYTNSYNQVYENNGAEYFLANVKSIFERDDLTIANLETTFTEATEKNPKAFNFKAPKEYVEILTKGNVELVNMANNHSHDYYQVGYDDTRKTLEEAKVNYYGNDDYYVYEKDDIKIGVAGIFCIEWYCTAKVDKAINDLKSKGVDSIILSFHWGIEKDYQQSNIQKYVGHYAIDHGADLVLGHHPHVIQGIEKYNNKYIVYSMANFTYGGHKNPKDKDTMLVQVNFKYKEKELQDTILKVYPVSVSSVKNTNDYRPTILEGEEATRVLNKIQQYSEGVYLL